MTTLTAAELAKLPADEREAKIAELLAETNQIEKRNERIKDIVCDLFTLETKDDKTTAIEQVLPFLIDNIDLAKIEPLRRLYARIQPKVAGETPEKVAKATRPKASTYQTFKIEELEDKAPTLYKYLVDKEGAAPLKADESSLVVQRKRFKDDANEAAVADGFDKAKTALDSLYERELKMKADDEREVLDLAITDFAMR